MATNAFGNIPQKYRKTFFNEAAFKNESWPDGRAKYVPNGLRMVETLLTDLQWEFFFTCWKYNLEFWRGGSRASLKFSASVPIYYSLLGKKLFGNGIKYPLLRFAGVPDRLIRNRLYLDFTGYKRKPSGMDQFAGEIVPAFHSVREKGLTMVDAS